MYFRHKFTGCARRSFGHSPLLRVVFGLRWQHSLHFPLCPEVGSSPQFHPSFILSSTCLQHEAVLLNNIPPFIPSLFLASLRSRFRLFNYAVPTIYIYIYSNVCSYSSAQDDEQDDVQDKSKICFITYYHCSSMQGMFIYKSTM